MGKSRTKEALLIGMMGFDIPQRRRYNSIVAATCGGVAGAWVLMMRHGWG